MDIERYKCFGATERNGSDALLVCGLELSCWSIQDRQQFTIDHNANACVFVDGDESGTGSPTLDFYYPHARSPLCLHAALAAAHHIWGRTKKRHDALSLLSSMNRQPLVFDVSTDDVYVSVESHETDFPHMPVSKVAKLLLCDSDVFVSLPRVASVGSAKLLVEVESKDVLYSLRPDLERIVEWGRKNGISGCFAYAQIGESEYEGRNFNHLNETLEDAATGVAAGALSVRLEADITLHQGRHLGNPCVIRTSRSAGRIRLGGRVARSS
ncbi:MAG TPA: PhzF family phenazine biosynthesis protein [Edaphobacter sp.]|jgi:PhzF family phenazine biosynthesis protein|nr:PhzF family phenazine biosynthesis protein [Edaphobacter sp.]